jgi:hypothetical protein
MITTCRNFLRGSPVLRADLRKTCKHTSIVAAAKNPRIHPREIMERLIIETLDALRSLSRETPILTIRGANTRRRAGSRDEIQSVNS